MQLPVELEGLSVLVVDDNATNRRIFEKTLEKWQMRPTLVDSGAAALSAVREAKDAASRSGSCSSTPTCRAWTGSRWREQSEATTPIRRAPTVMMLTSSGESHDSARCRTLGISSYSIKPVRQAALLEAILTALGDELAGANPAGRRRPPDGRLCAAAHPARRRQRRQSARGDGLLENGGHRVTVAENGTRPLAALEAPTFDLVLMDMQMPEMGGAEAIEADPRPRDRRMAGTFPSSRSPRTR